jgi:hypothetical protein
MFYFAIVSTYFGLVEKYQSEIHHYLINPTSARSPHGKKGALSGLISLVVHQRPSVACPMSQAKSRQVGTVKSTIFRVHG